MTTLIDRIVITVPDLGAARNEYQQLLGVEAVEFSEFGIGARAWFFLSNVVIELRVEAVSRAVLSGLVFSRPDCGPLDSLLDNPFGLRLETCDGSVSAQYRSNNEFTPSSVSVDHIVLRTASADACVDFFGAKLGIRLALDKTVPQWGGRMLFFRTGKLTLEVIEAKKDTPEADFFWGVAFGCDDMDARLALLQQRGIAHSAIREGRKAGTRVMTVKSHCLGIPTLLVEPAAKKPVSDVAG